MTERAKRIVIIGAGYAGMLATTRLAGKLKREIKGDEVVVTLVNGADRFVERLRLHQLAANQPMAFKPIADILLHTGVVFVQGWVTALNPAERMVTVKRADKEETLSYDYLVYALGSTIERDHVPGVRQYAYVLMPGGPRSAVALRERLSALALAGFGGKVTVVGGGATGVETAAEFAETYPGLQVTLVTQGEVADFTTPQAARYIRRSLERLGVTLREHTTVAEVRADEICTTTGEIVSHALCVWTAGFTVSPIAQQAGLGVNERGQIQIDPFMRSVTHSQILAVGDAAHPVEQPGAPVRMAAYTAVVMGAHGADCLYAILKDKPPKPFSFAYAGQAIGLGRQDAVGFNTYPDDQPNRPYFRGKVGYHVREFFVHLLARLPGMERRYPGFFMWLGKGRYVARQKQMAKTAHLSQLPQ